MGGKDYRLFIGYQDNYWEMTENLTWTEERVLKYLIKNLDFGNMVYLKGVAIASGCNLDKANVSKALSSLQKYDVIAKVKNGEYMVNPLLLRKGRDTHNELMEKYQRVRRAA